MCVFVANPSNRSDYSPDRVITADENHRKYILIHSMSMDFAIFRKALLCNLVIK